MIGCHGIDDPDEPVLAVQLQRTKPCTQLNVDRSVGLKKKKKGRRVHPVGSGLHIQPSVQVSFCKTARDAVG